MNVLVYHRRTFSEYKIILRCISSSLAYFHDADRPAIKQITWSSPRVKTTQNRGQSRADPSWQNLKLQHQQDLESQFGLILKSINSVRMHGWRCKTVPSQRFPTALIPTASRNTRAYMHTLEKIKRTASKQPLTLLTNPPGEGDNLKRSQIPSVRVTVSNNTKRNSLCWQIILVAPTLCAKVSACVWYPICKESFYARYKIFH